MYIHIGRRYLKKELVEYVLGAALIDVDTEERAILLRLHMLLFERAAVCRLMMLASSVSSTLSALAIGCHHCHVVVVILLLAVACL